MNALVRLIDAEMVPSPPYFIQDYAASVLEQALLAPAMVTDKVLICQTGFRRDACNRPLVPIIPETTGTSGWSARENNSTGAFVFIPTAEMRKAMEEAVS